MFECESKRILMIIARKDFRDEEYFIPLEIFQKAGAKVTTASSKTGTLFGVLGGEAEASENIKNIISADYDAIVFVGGDGAKEYFENFIAYKLAQEFYEKEKIVAAICIAPVILAKSGILKGKTATVWSSPMDKTGIKILEANGAKVSDNNMEVSDNIITANGREVAEEFARTIIRELDKA